MKMFNECCQAVVTLAISGWLVACNLPEKNGNFVNNTRSQADCVKPTLTQTPADSDKVLKLGAASLSQAEVEKLSAACDDLSMYVCEKRVFRPDITTGTATESFCISHETLGEICHTATVRNYDTSGARDANNAELFAQGRSYNYEESNCYHSGLADQDGWAAKGAAPSLGEALNAAFKACHQALSH